MMWSFRKKRTILKFLQKNKGKVALTVFTFHTVSEALHFEKVLRKEALPVRLRPVPRMISSSCGTCAVVHRQEEKPVLEAVASHNLVFDEIHRVEE